MTGCALVTGASGGIGSAICARLSKAGMAVLGVDLAEPRAGSSMERFVRADLAELADGVAATDALVGSVSQWLNGDVRMYGIEPAAGLTDMLRAGFAGSPEFLNRLADCHPSGEICAPEQIAELVYFLSSSGMAGLDGSAIEVGGGISGPPHDPD